MVDGVSFQVDAGETIGIVGEYGQRKVDDRPRNSPAHPAARKDYRRLGDAGRNGALHRLDQKEMRKIRGHEISMILQDPMTALNPSFTIGSRSARPSRSPRAVKGKPLVQRVVEMLRKVHIPAPERRAQDYPHQMSGGIRPARCRGDQHL